MDERMRRRAKVLVGVAVAWISVASGVAHAVVAPTVPAAIAVPAGNVVFLAGQATGTQIYTCQSSSGSAAWTLLAPAALLKDSAGHVIVWHYAGPSWRALDGSTVVGVRAASAPAPIPNAIPWLLLSASSTTAGPSGGTTLAHTTYIQRINTSGGVAPTTGCDAAHLGATTAVPYTATYYFYRAA